MLLLAVQGFFAIAALVLAGRFVWTVLGAVVMVWFGRTVRMGEALPPREFPISHTREALYPPPQCIEARATPIDPPKSAA
jgi:hypothetical protein